MEHIRQRVTPQMAETWLRNNTDNRNLSQGYVDKLARDMLSGEFAYVADPIRFDTGGNLIDGQHRLTAIAQSGVTLDMLVVTGMKRDDRRFLDRGRKRRVADNLRMDYGIASATTVASVTRMVLRWNTGALRNNSVYRPTDTEVYDYAVNHVDELSASAAYAARVRTGIGAQLTATGTVHYLTMQQEAITARPFWERVEHGTGVYTGDPALALRNAIVRAAANNLYAAVEQHMAMQLRAWRSAVNGRSLSRLSIQGISKLTDDSFDLE